MIKFRKNPKNAPAGHSATEQIIGRAGPVPEREKKSKKIFKIMINQS